MGYRTLLFVILFSFSTIASFANDSLLAGIDTLEFFSDDINRKHSKEQLKAILISDDIRSIAQLFNKTAVYYVKNGQSRKSIGYFNQAVKRFMQLGDSSEAAICYNYLGLVYYQIGQYDVAINNYKATISIKKKSKDAVNLVASYDDLGFVYLNTCRYENSIDVFSKALLVSLSVKDTNLVAQQYYFIGTVYNELDEIDSVVKYFELSLKYDILTGNSKNIAASQNNIAIAYYQKYKLPIARNYLVKADTLIAKIKSEKDKAVVQNNIANVLYNQKKYKEALALYNKSLKIKTDLMLEEGIAITEFNIGKLYYTIGDINAALKSLNSCHVKAKRFNNLTILSRVNFLLSEIYQKQGDDKKAYEYYKEFVASKYSILGDDLNNQISETATSSKDQRIKASSLKKEIQMQRLFSDYNSDIKSKEIKYLEEKKAYKQYINYAFIGLLVLVLIGVLLSFRRNKARKHANILLNKQNVEIAEQNILLEKQADDLRESNIELEKLSIVASETDNAVLIMDKTGNFEWVNAAFTRITGFTYEELVSSLSKNIIGETTPDYIKDKFVFCVANKQTVSYNFETRTKTGDVLWLAVTLTPILGKLGEIERLVSIDSDITALKLAESEILQQKEEIQTQKEEIEEQRDYVLGQKSEIEIQKQQLEQTLLQLRSTQKKLVESEKMAALGSLVAGVSHEINTPVGIGIAASSSMVSKTDTLSELFTEKKMKMSDLQLYIESTTQACDLILANLNRTAELVQSFKQVSVDNMTENKRVFLLKDYINDIVRSLAPKLKNRPIQLVLDGVENIELNSYPGAFAQIFTNFIINSLLHAFEEPQSGIISLETQRTETNLIIRYKDNGKGIPQENLHKIFDPFFTTNMQHGTGLGMNITYNLVTQKLGGEISLESEVGQGVIFTISLPFANIQ